jgi:hypothetical protein
VTGDKRSEIGVECRWVIKDQYQAAGITMVQLRPGNTTDLDFLKEMLFEAFFWDTSTKRPLFASFRDAPEFS